MYEYRTRPGLVTAIAFMTLASGIINLFLGSVASATVLSSFWHYLPAHHHPAYHPGRI